MQPDVLLIRPKRAPSDGRLIMPLGLMALSAYLKREGISTQIIDEEATKRDIAQQIDSPICGISMCMQQQEARALEIADKIRMASDKTKIVLGGTQATFTEQPHQTIRGEGEIGLLDICTGTTHETQKVDVETLPLPAYDDIDIEHYFRYGRGENPYTRNRRVLQYESSRGCQFGCAFCSSKRFWGPWRGKSAIKVLDELQELYARYKMDEVNFVDANLLARPARAKDIFRAWPSSLPGVSWSNPGGIWIGGLDTDLLDLMLRTGCTQLTFPIETTNPDLLSRYNLRKVDIAHAINIAKYCKKIGIALHGFFIAGMPGQTIEDVKADLAFARSCHFESVSVHLLTKFPGTDIDSENVDYYTSRNSELANTIASMSARYNRQLLFRNPIRYIYKYWL